LQETTARADGQQAYRFDGNKNRKKKKTQLTISNSRKAPTEPAVDYATVTGGSVSSLSTNGGLLSGIVSEFVGRSRWKILGDLKACGQ